MDNVNEQRIKYYNVGELIDGLNKMIEEGIITKETCVASSGPDEGGYEISFHAYVGLTLLPAGEGPVDKIASFWPEGVQREYDKREQESLGKPVLEFLHFGYDEFKLDGATLEQ